ncbi:MAG TPA: twin-arginine translocase subunit TatC [Rubricoccaceae bacterium]|nr:twin-arginine translocase subunit TatC [Rubricoccaceae bacterium]
MLRLLRDKLARPRPGASGDGAAPKGLPPGAPTLPTGARGGAPDPHAAQAGEMPFLDHLEELRWRILKALGGVALCTVACLFFAEWVVDRLLLGPTHAAFFTYHLLGMDAVDVALQNRTITGQFFAYFGTVLATGLVLGSPVVIYQLWRFVEPGLYPEERRGLRFVAVYATFFFVLGIAFGYCVLTPLALQFFAQFTISDAIVNEFDITKYFSMVLTWSFGAGLLFELPVVVFFLAKLGIATPAALRKGRKYALIVILVVAAVLTPPDPVSQIIMAIPLLILYELSIWQAGLVERRREREAQREAARP